MEAGQPSRSAMMAAVARGSHRLRDQPPWILDDPFALVLVGPEWEEIAAASGAAVRGPVLRQSWAGVVVRSRYAEDRLAGGRYTQYVILGAGLDSFAWRYPDLVGPLRVFEVDHPSTQAWKRERVVSAQLPTLDGHAFVPVDFEADTLRRGLDAAGFDWSQRTLFSCVGVTMYLMTDSLEASLRAVAGCASASEIVLSYNVAPPFLDEMGREFLAYVSRTVAETGEPLQTFFSPTDAEALLVRCGLEVAEHPTPEGLCRRYFAGRPDGLRPYTNERLIAARVPGRVVVDDIAASVSRS